MEKQSNSSNPKNQNQDHDESFFWSDDDFASYFKKLNNDERAINQKCYSHWFMVERHSSSIMEKFCIPSVFKHVKLKQKEEAYEEKPDFHS